MSDARDRGDAELARLLRAAYPDESDDFERPDDASIRAYVEGTADDGQFAAVEEAMLLSEAFREEIHARRQVERDLEHGDLAGRMAEVDPPADLLGPSRHVETDRPGVIAAIGAWLWKPQIGYGLALAASLSLMLMRGGPAPQLAQEDGGAVQQFALAPVMDVRNVQAPAYRIHVLPGRSRIDLIPLYGFDDDAGERFVVEATLTGPGDTPVRIEDDDLGFIPDGEGGRLLRWRIPAGALAPGVYVAIFTLTPRTDEAAGPVETVTLRFELATTTP